MPPNDEGWKIEALSRDVSTCPIPEGAELAFPIGGAGEDMVRGRGWLPTGTPERMLAAAWMLVSPPRRLSMGPARMPVSGLQKKTAIDYR